MLYIIARGSDLQKWHHQIVELHNYVFPDDVIETYEEICQWFDEPTWVLVSDKGRLVGMMVVGSSSRGTFIYNLAVDQNYRRSKIGTRMIEHFKDRFSGPIRICVARTRTEARAFYQAIGAHKESETPSCIYYTISQQV